jgi:peptidoglycan hydrolase-like protein with peptidoglycan-binding domain
MTPQNARRVLVAFVLLSAGVGVNILALQPIGQRGASGRAGKPDGKPDVRREIPQPGSSSPVAAKPAPPAGGDNPETVSAIQRELAARDYGLGAPDGLASPATRAAIMAWEHDNGLQLTGEPTAAVLKAIILGVDAASAGQIADELKAMPREREPRTRHLIRTVQQSLADIGYVLGPPSGEMTEDTVRAIREFEVEQALPLTGRISAPLMARLARAGKSTGTAAQR